LERSIHQLLVTIGLGYFIIFATIELVSDWLSGTIPFFDYYHIPFIILFAVSVILAWDRPRVGYLMAAIAGLAAVTIFTPFTFVKGVSSPADSVLFVYDVTIFPLILMAVSYSILALLERRNPTRPHSPGFSFVQRTIAILVVGFIIGSLTVGALTAGTENQLLNSASSSADITIPLGAGTPGNHGYNPLNLTVTAGKIVTWVNKDTTVHSVTSTTGLFDSGNLNPGQTYSHQFSQPGVYPYHCTLHLWMKGNITVTP
jgi:plastocyanin